MTAAITDDREPLRLRRPLFHPSRWPVAAGFVMVAVGAFAPWQVIVDPVGFKEVINGASGGDALGLQLLLFTAATLLVCALPSVAGSRTRFVQLLPALGAAATVVIAIRSYLKVAPAGIWNPGQSSQVVVEWGMWLTLAGSALIALGGIATTVIVVRDRPLTPEPWEPRADLSFLRPFVSAIAGFAAAVAGVDLILPSLPGAYQQSSVPMLFAGTVVMTLAIYSLLGFVTEIVVARRRRPSPRTGDGLPAMEPLRRQRKP